MRLQWRNISVIEGNHQNAYITGSLWGGFPRFTGGSSSQRANVKYSVFMSWRHHDAARFLTCILDTEWDWFPADRAQCWPPAVFAVFGQSTKTGFTEHVATRAAGMGTIQDIPAHRTTEWVVEHRLLVDKVIIGFGKALEGRIQIKNLHINCHNSVATRPNPSPQERWEPRPLSQI